MRDLIPLFKGFTSDLVTLQRWQFQLAALNGFIKHLIEGQAQRVYSLDRMRIEDDAPPVVGVCSILSEIIEWIFRRSVFGPTRDNKNRSALSKTPAGLQALH